MAKKPKKIITTPRDHMSAIPVFKFPPIPTKDYVVVYRSKDDDMLFSVPVDFIAVCEWSEESENETEIFEGICYLLFESDGFGFFEIISPNSVRGCGNRVGIAKTDALYWYNNKTNQNEPIYKWDNERARYCHPVLGDVIK